MMESLPRLRFAHLPTPVEEMLREVVDHYKHCSKAMEESDEFCKRAQAWKGNR